MEDATELAKYPKVIIHTGHMALMEYSFVTVTVTAQPKKT